MHVCFGKVFHQSLLDFGPVKASNWWLCLSGGGSPKVINNSSSENSFNSVVIFSLSTELTNIPASVISWCGLIWRTESRGDEVKSGESVTKRATGGGVVEIWLIKYRERKVRDAENGWAVTCKPHQLWQNQCRCGRPEGAAMLIMKHTGEECVFLYTHTHTDDTDMLSFNTSSHVNTSNLLMCSGVMKQDRESRLICICRPKNMIYKTHCSSTLFIYLHSNVAEGTEGFRPALNATYEAFFLQMHLNFCSI